MIASPLIIAEAGVNHNGDMARAFALIDAAAVAGADVVKFQAFRADGLVTQDAGTAAYQASNTGQDNQSALLRALELSKDDFAKLAEHCTESGIEFLCTPFDVAMTADLVAMGMKRIKIASGELTNSPALRHFAELGLPILLSTGMATLAEVGQALDDLQAAAGNIICLHCTSLYPAPMATLNLQAMASMEAAFGIPVGYSDHSLGDHAAVAAVALGACVIEKHFTLDRSLPGPDHRASLEPDELKTMVRRLRDIAVAMGDGVKAPAEGERDTAALVRRSWHACHPLARDHIVTTADVILKRPADGLAPARSPVGRRLTRALAADQPVCDSDFE
jgi:N,N'-diacetyllegionaminate synthase